MSLDPIVNQFNQVTYALMDQKEKWDEELKVFSPTLLMMATAVAFCAVPFFKTMSKSATGVLSSEVLADKLLCIPFIHRTFEKKMKKELLQFQKENQKAIEFYGPMTLAIPEEGWEISEVRELIHDYARKTENELKNIQYSGMIYTRTHLSDIDESSFLPLYTRSKDLESLSKDLRMLQTEAFFYMQDWNILHDAFKAPIHIERQVICMVAKAFGGEPNQVMGTVTPGGTESLREICRIMANLSAYKHMQRGEGIILKTRMAHVGLDKGIQDYGLKAVTVQCDERGRMDLKHLKECLDRYGKKVLMIFASAPNYPYGTIDPIESMAQLAEEYKVCMHVDACLGAFHINYFDKFKADQILKYPGVTSLSADPHKRGMTAKGHSVLVTKRFEEHNLMFHAIYAFARWSGGIYGTKGPFGSEPCRALNPLITMLAVGNKTYREIAHQIQDVTEKMAQVIREYDGELRLVLNPETNIVVLALDQRLRLPDEAIYTFYDLMKKRNFVFNKLNDYLLHFCVTARFLNDETLLTKFDEALRESLNELKQICEECQKEGKKLPGYAGAYSTIKNAEFPSLKNLSLVEYFQNFFFGARGVHRTIKNHFIAILSP